MEIPTTGKGQAVGPGWLTRLRNRAGHWMLRSYLDFPLLVTEMIRRFGKAAVAERLLNIVFDAYPYDWPLAARLGDIIYENHEQEFQRGTKQRNDFLLNAIFRSFPSERLTEAYFENLEQILARQTRRHEPGRVILGLGSGRSGSTTLTAIIASVEGALATHENPPLVFWEPLRTQVDFHFRRFTLLAQYHSFVFDCAHWWINLLDPVFARFPDAKAIALYRNTELCVQSWIKITTEPWNFNYWVVPRNRIWQYDRWYPTHPNYPLPPHARRSPASAKEGLIRRYVTEYNDRLKQLAAEMPQRILLLRTEELNLPKTRERISHFLGASVGGEAVHLNVNTIADAPTFRF